MQKELNSQRNQYDTVVQQVHTAENTITAQEGTIQQYKQTEQQLQQQLEQIGQQRTIEQQEATAALQKCKQIENELQQQLVVSAQQHEGSQRQLAEQVATLQSQLQNSELELFNSDHQLSDCLEKFRKVEQLLCALQAEAAQNEVRYTSALAAARSESVAKQEKLQQSDALVVSLTQRVESLQVPCLRICCCAHPALIS